MKPQSDPLLSTLAEIKISYSHKLPPSKLPKIKSSFDAITLLRTSWDVDTIEMVETFKVLFLNRANRALGIMTVSTGGISTALADPSRVFAGAIKAAAHSMILCHNHPSGNLSSSVSDKALTKRMKQTGEIIGIKVLDHIILTSESAYSMADGGEMYDEKDKDNKEEL